MQTTTYSYALVVPGTRPELARAALPGIMLPGCLAPAFATGRDCNRANKRLVGCCHPHLDRPDGTTYVTSRDAHTVSVDEKVRNALALHRETKTIRLRPKYPARLASAVRMGAEAHTETFARAHTRHRPKQGRTPKYIVR
jgi:hypothetical protein